MISGQSVHVCIGGDTVRRLWHINHCFGSKEHRLDVGVAWCLLEAYCLVVTHYIILNIHLRTVTSCSNTHQHCWAKALAKSLSLHRGSSHNVITNERRAVAVCNSHFIILTLWKLFDAIIWLFPLFFSEQMSGKQRDSFQWIKAGN